MRPAAGTAGPRGRGERTARRPPGPAKKVLFSAAAVLILFTLLEGGLRLAGFEYDGVPRRLSFHQEKYLFGEGAHTFERDDRLFWRLVPGQPALGVNPQGFRGPPFHEAKPPGRVRIECLGCSVTFGLHEPASYASMLEEILNREAGGEKRFEVYNLGVPGYSSFQGLRLFREKGLAWHPDVVTVLFGWNDHWLAKSVPDKRQRPPTALEKALLESRIYQAIFRLYAAFRESNRTGPPAPGDFRVSLEDFEANLRAMVALARARGVKPLLVTAPTSIRGPGDVPAFLVRDGLITEDTNLPALHGAYNEAVRRGARETGTPLADCARELAPRARRYMMADGIHPNAEGHRRMARVIAGVLLRAYPELRSGRAGAAEGRPRREEAAEAEKGGE